MTQQEELHVVFGATGESGRAVIRELLRQGKRVRAVHRSGHSAVSTLTKSLSLSFSETGT